MSRSLKYDSNFFFDHRHIYIYIYIWTPRSITLPRSRCACGVIIIRECGSTLYVRKCGITLYVGLQHAVPPTNTKFKPLLLPTQADIQYTNTHKHRTSYFKSTLTFLGPAKCWRSISADRQKREILAIFIIIGERDTLWSVQSRFSIYIICVCVIVHRSFLPIDI